VVFINKYPDLSAAENANLKDLHRVLKPLGLRHRADAFKKALRQLKAQRTVTIPNKEGDLLELFGVGRYIARAVLCFGYRKKVGLIDPSISRIFERYFGLSSVPKRPHTSYELWALADLIIRYNRKDSRMLNWGLIDIGREICKKRNPECAICPILKRCVSAPEFLNEQKS
jgi:A/G-specific adenine glycosylase